MRFDKILVVDIEATCWEEPKDDDISEIIEIGITPINTKSGDLSESRSIIVKPERSKISQYCTELTTLTQEDVNNGISFSDACNLLLSEYKSKKYVWASYGNYDKNQFRNQCKREHIEYPFSKDHINVKSLVALKYSLRRDAGMENILKLLDMPLVGTHHRGVDDSRNIANILSKVIFGK